jgi:hypothetical protein
VLLQADLAQQMHNKARLKQQAAAVRAEPEQALLVSSKPDAAAIQALRRKQQAEYRCGGSAGSKHTVDDCDVV